MLLHSSRSLSYVLWCNNLFLIRINIKFFIPEQLSFSFRMWILGHDTTASAICWAVYSLGKYQDLQEKVYQELMQVLGDRQKLQWYVDIIEWYRIPINVFEQFGLSRYLVSLLQGGYESAAIHVDVSARSDEDACPSTRYSSSSHKTPQHRGRRDSRQLHGGHRRPCGQSSPRCLAWPQGLYLIIHIHITVKVSECWKYI